MDPMSNKLEVEFLYLPVINFAIQQNKIPIIRQLSIKNKSNTALNNIKICLTSEPDFSDETSAFIDILPSNESVRIEPIQLKLSTTYFAQATERASGHITIKIYSDSQQLFEEKYPIDVLAYDQWAGISILPEMLSAFITPNHPATVPIIKRAADILEQWTGNPSLDEYQSRTPDRVQKQMAAVYTAISEHNIIYSTVPASFEESGQRIRLTDIVMAQKLGTCIDMALLYASCLEAIGIHPLIVITNGHAFAGGWLVPETFPDNIIDDVSLLTKRTAKGINDITLVETTCMTQGNNTDFDQAVKIANTKLTQPNDFVLAIDVKRSRYSGIRPIPQRVLNGQHWEIKDNTPIVDKSQVLPENINPYDLSGISTNIVVTKQLLWERKLLDLSLRNNLLNIRITKNTLQLISVDIDRFEDALANGDEFRILHKPNDWENPLSDFGLYQSIPESDPIIELIKSELSQKRLRAYLSENELSKALTHLYRSSRTAMEENGANTLYIALGLLKWYETPSSERPRYAPILLLPVEIIRKSAAKGYVIRSREEDAMMNITLLEMLRQNFGITIAGLDPLPTDESGLNVKLIYSIIRNSIKNQKKWDVEEQGILGIFSFNKFIMWNDIHNNSHKLIKNEIVSSLMNGKIEWNVDTETTEASELDKQLSPAEIVLPINADSSQLEAIFEAVHDKSFILHGPPGTGKSQTITNIIANALYRGKRVLFVAEKMAALSVVQNRLAAIGLAPFCLELHSNKTKKSTILSQLKEASEVVKQIPPEQFGEEAERILALRIELNAYIESLHHTYPFGFSLYDAITQYLSLNVDAAFNIPQSYFKELNKKTIQEWQDAIETLVRTANACGHPYNHPLTGIRVSEYSASVKDKAVQEISTTIDLLSRIKVQLGTISNLLGEQGTSYDKKQIETISGIINKLLSIPELTPALITMPNLNEALAECQDVCIHGEERDKIKNQLLSTFTDEVLKTDAKNLLNSWNQASNKWFLPKHFGQKKIRKQLNTYALSHIDNAIVKSTLHQIIKYQEEEDYVNTHANNYPVLFGKYGRKNNEDWSNIGQIIEDASIINSLILNYTQDIAKAAAIKTHLSNQLSEGIASFKSIYGNSLNEVNTSLNQLTIAERNLFEILGISKDVLYNNSQDWVNVALSKLNNWLNNIDLLKDWYQWLVVCNKLEQLNIGFVAEKYKADNIPTDKVEDIFKKSLCQAAINYIISIEPDLELFKGKIFNEIIEKYKRLTSEFEKLTKQELFAKLASNIPSFTREAAQNSEVGILQRNIKNNARGISIRKLFDQIPTLLSRMCPCMLMSPISVAQYIDADADKFDLIVFDEASQMPTYEAIGAIARGKNIVIVGDPKQMPPTNFFSVNSVDEENIEMEDLESILDDCLALSMPSKYLLWHYRSKHESLIAFSNSEYYDNKLLTFPSPDNIESKVKLIQIEGFYDKGKSRQNKSEAQAVVDEIARRLRDESLRKKSIGVVTFSSVQQSLIEDLLSDLFVSNPDLETLALECEEPLFIKNLENVQGDERDIILFSVGYGPDSNGRVSMNFGPLNRIGGERRLNVAVSRARYEMIIYSTLRSDHIDLNRTSAMGVVGLKRFLEYAERGERSITNNQIATESVASIESIVADRLRAIGYTVHTNIGCSGYRVDIGIVDNDNPSKYKLGILCDGDNYKRTKTIRDREIVQNSVLKLLGWNICRIWTMDWWENPDAVIESIKNAINTANQPEPIQRVQPYVRKESSPVISKSNEIKSSNNNPNRVKPSDKESSERKYKSVSLDAIESTTEDLMQPENKRKIVSQITQLITNEAPISKTLLYKKIIQAWGLTRLGQRIEAYFDALIDECGYFRTGCDDSVFLWIDEEQHHSYTIFRTDSGRDATDLAPEEVANGIKHILTDEISLPITDLRRISAQLFGFARTGTHVENAMQRGIEEAVNKGYVRIENDRVIVN